MQTYPNSVDEYLDTLRWDQRSVLNTLRQITQAAAPDLEESMQYGFPTYNKDGEPLLAFNVDRKHVNVFILDNKTLSEHRAELGSTGEVGKRSVRYADPAAVDFDALRPVIEAMASA